jgi:hypothetical protein
MSSGVMTVLRGQVDNTMSEDEVAYNGFRVVIKMFKVWQAP